jgi:hypothetical protein
MTWRRCAPKGGGGFTVSRLCGSAARGSLLQEAEIEAGVCALAADGFEPSVDLVVEPLPSVADVVGDPLRTSSNSVRPTFSVAVGDASVPRASRSEVDRQGRRLASRGSPTRRFSMERKARPHDPSTTSVARSMNTSSATTAQTPIRRRRITPRPSLGMHVLARVDAPLLRPARSSIPTVTRRSRCAPERSRTPTAA